MRTRALHLASLLCLLLSLAPAARADDGAPAVDLTGYIFPEEEAPTALLGATIGDAEVGLVAEGSWKLGLDGGVGLRIIPGQGITFPASVASLASGLALSHEPSVVIGVHIDDRFFLEAAVSDAAGGEGSSDLLPAGIGYLSMGYAATGEEILRNVTIGTRDVEMGEYPFLRIPAMGSSSLGAGVLLEGPKGSQEMLLRMDKLPAASVTYVGMNLVDEERLALEDYLRGSSFILPDSDVLGLSVLIEDSGGSVAGGDGRHYRAAGVDDARVSASDGTIYLYEPAEGSVLVWYQDAAGNAVGDPTLGRGALPAPGDGGIDPDASGVDFSWEGSYLGSTLSDRRVTVDGVGYLRLWEPGEFSPFEVPSSYALEGEADEETAISIDTVRRGSDLACEDIPSGLDYRPYPEDGRFVVSLGADPREEMRERFPFPDPERLLYGPGASAPSGYQGCEIRVRRLVPVDRYQISAPLVPGSVQITRNGVEESGFSVDYGTGLIELASPVAAGDVIEVRYRSTAGSAVPAQLVLGWGNRIPLGSGAALTLSGGLLWSTASEAYSEEPGQSTGGVVASVAIEGSLRSPEETTAGVRSSLEYEAAAGVSISLGDTTGARRLFGMEGSGWSVGLTEETSRPSATPGSDEGLPPSVEQSSRGKLLYRDYRNYDALGGWTLFGYDVSDPPQAYGYEDGEVTGPYEVGGSASGSSGTSLALDFSMDPDEYWVGMQLPVSSGGRIDDLSWVEGIICSLLARATEGSYDVYLQIGALGEDLDGDSVLDAEASSSSAGFSFDDTANGVSLLVGAGPLGNGNGILDTEDIDGNGFLDVGEAAYAVLVGPSEAGPPLSSGTEGEWATASYVFPDTERLKLTRARAVRILVVKSSEGICSGRLLVDRIVLSGSAFWAHPGGEGSASVREVDEADLAEQPALLLPAAYPEVDTRYHADASAQEVLELSWEDAATVELRGYVSPGSGGIPYRRLTLYLRMPSLTLSAGTESATVEVTLRDASDRGIRARFTTGGFDDWRKLVVDGEEGTIALAGEAPEGASIEWDPSGDLIELDLAVSGASAGLLYLDEVALAEPRVEAGVAASGSVKLQLDGPLVAVAGTVLVSSVAVEERLSAYSGGFSSLFGSPSSTPTFRSSTDLRVVTAIGQVDAFAVVDGSMSGVTVSGGHRIALPRLLPARWPLGIGVTDSFSYGGRESESAVHEMGISFTAGRAFSSSTRATVRAASGTLDQSWQEALSLDVGQVLKVSLGGSLAKEASGYQAPGDWYGPWWADGVLRLVPWVEGQEEWRKGKGEIDLELPLSPLGLGLGGTVAFASSDIVDGRREQEEGIMYELRLPFAFRPSGGAELSIVPSYLSELMLTSEADEGTGDFSGDLAELQAAILHHGWMFGYWPVADVLHPAAMAAVSTRLTGSNDYPLTRAEWHRSLSLGLSRGAGSRIIDLVLPAYASLSLGRRVRLEGDLSDAATEVSASLRFTALNMFGSSGSHRVFSFYDRDELSATLTATVGLPYVESPDVPVQGELTASHLLSLKQGKGIGLEIENKFQYRQAEDVSFAEKGEARLGWLHLDGIPLPTFLLAAPGKAGFRLEPTVGSLRHVESLEVEVAGPLRREGGSVSVTASHESTVAYEDLGSLSAYASLAVDFLKTGGIWAPGIGIQAGIQIELRF